MFLILLFPGRADAKRKLPSAAGKSAVKTITGQTAAKVKFRSDRKAVILNLSNLGTAKSVSYELQYETNGLMQGAGGSVTIAGDSASREILFGSCSGGVCNYDKKDIKGYIGGNTLMEMGLAFFLKKKIYLLNEIPEISYKEEILGVKPIIIIGDLSKIE